VVVSDEVGAGRDVNRAVCSVFPNGDLDAVEKAVRGVIANARSQRRAELRAVARGEAERLFAPPTVAAILLSEPERARRKSTSDNGVNASCPLPA
jgi:hypothetical protein